MANPVEIGRMAPPLRRMLLPLCWEYRDGTIPSNFSAAVVNRQRGVWGGNRHVSRTTTHSAECLSQCFSQLPSLRDRVGNEAQTSNVLASS